MTATYATYPANHEVRLKGGKRLYGLVNYVDYLEECFYLLQQNQIGMQGKTHDGTPVRFDACDGVYAAEVRAGVYDSMNLLEEWRQAARRMRSV